MSSVRINRVRLATEMARREWRYKHLAELAGVSQATMSALTGGQAIHSDTAQRIAAALNMPLEQLVAVRGAPHLPQS